MTLIPTPYHPVYLVCYALVLVLALMGAAYAYAWAFGVPGETAASFKLMQDLYFQKIGDPATVKYTGGWSQADHVPACYNYEFLDFNGTPHKAQIFAGNYGIGKSWIGAPSYDDERMIKRE